MTLTLNGRTADHPVAPMFLERWSPRAFTGEPIPQDTLLTIFEAARWAPSSGNMQPCRLVWARRDTPHWPTLLDLLNAGNQGWCARAAALVAVVAKTTTPPGQDGTEKPSRSHAFDTGAAWMAMALQAQALGWSAHGMLGIHLGRIPQALRLPLDHEVQCLVAIGRRGDPAILDEQTRAREMPNGRHPQHAFVHEGGFPE